MDHLQSALEEAATLRDQAAALRAHADGSGMFLRMAQEYTDRADHLVECAYRARFYSSQRSAVAAAIAAATGGKVWNKGGDLLRVYLPAGAGWLAVVDLMRDFKDHNLTPNRIHAHQGVATVHLAESARCAVISAVKAEYNHWRLDQS